MRGKTNSVITSGGGTSENTLKNLLDATKSCANLFSGYKGTYVDELISFDDTENVENFTSMFNNCLNLVTIPLLNTINADSFVYTFYNCSKLKSIPALNVSRVTSFASAFSNCYILESIHMTGATESFNISSSERFTTDALHEIITNLGTVTSSKTLTMGSTNLAKVSEEYVTIATNKGWTLA